MSNYAITEQYFMLYPVIPYKFHAKKKPDIALFL